MNLIPTISEDSFFKSNLKGKVKKTPKTIYSSQEKAIVRVLSLLNNTFVTLTTLDGKTLAWSSGGTEGFKGSRRSTSYAAQLSGESIGRIALEKKLSVVSA